MGKNKRAGFTKQDVARIKSATCKQTGGTTPRDSLAARAESILTRQAPPNVKPQRN